MGQVISSIFGGNSYKSPDPVQYEPAPTRTDDKEEAGIRDAERRKRQAKAGGVRSTLLTNPLGGASNLLGQTQT